MSGWNEAQMFSMLVGVAVKSSVVLGIAWLVAAVLGGRSAAVRHLVWTGAAAAVLALPVLSGILPTLHFTTPAALAQWDTGLVFRSASSGAQAASGAAAPETARRTRAAGAPGRPDFRPVLAAIWCAGTTLVLLQMVVAYAFLCRIRRRAREFPDDGTARQAATLLGFRRPVRVLESTPGSMPLTFGFRHPVVFLPGDALAWTAECRRMVLLHELAHIRRADAATHVLARAALALNWWNPLAWIGWREFLKERERAADDLVLTAGAAASTYAGRLLEMARSLQSAPASAWAAIAVARRSQIEGRLLAILDGNVNRKQAGRVAVTAASLLAVLLVAPFAAIRAQTEAPSLVAELDATIRAANAQKNHEILENAATAYERLRKYDAARTLLDNALVIRGRVSGEQSASYAVGLINLARLASKRGQFAEAQGFYSKAVALGDRPEVVPGLLFLGRAAFGSRNYEAAFDLLQRAWNVDPSGPQAGRALTWMADTKDAMETADEAESLFQRALATEPPDSSDAALTMDLYARFLRRHNRLADAEATETRAKAIRKDLVAKLMPPAPSSGAVYRVGRDVAAPQLLEKIEPSYTDEARALKIQGTEVLYVEIGPDGVARNFRVMRGLGFGLDEAGMEAVSHWRFKPGTRDGQPVTVAATIEVNWRLL